ncbi:polysaccharide biosynthesis tyrosine autokinase [Nostoc sp. FACHB-152]|nr:polysaccharide biosynthesis tyrosine autokinase [Nostoc sp. FACHB-145]MBD2445781.1 polysaccharide biosynthesis tyrosine autokinase [Nostoc sp. FACHB-152]MBD2466895.1 polysaccharide biosynthesis tyrosine autokinase [Nostoc sp. FACHB-145]
MEINKYRQLEQINQNYQYYETGEGGLNLIDVKDKIIRQIHIVAGTTIVMSSLAFFSAVNRAPTYKTSFEIFSEPVTIETKVTSPDSQSGSTTQEITAVGLDEVQLKNLKSPEIIMPVVLDLKSKHPNINYDSIVNTLGLKTNTEKNVLEVSYQHGESNQVKDVSQALAKAYLKYSLKRRQSGLNRGLEFLEEQIPRIQTQVNILNQQLQQLRKKYNFIDPQVQGSQISERIDSLLVKQVEYKSQLEKTQRLATLAKKELSDKSTASTTTTLFGTSRYNALLEDLQKIDSEIARKSAVYTEQSIELQTLQEQRRAIVALIDLEIPTIQQKIDNQIKLEQKQIQDNSKEIAEMQRTLQEWLEVTREYESIDRRMKITAQPLNELLVKREVLRLESAQREAPWKLLTLPGDPTTDAASVANYVVLGAFLGLLIGIGTALLFEQYKNLVYNPNQIQKIITQPILGIIPFIRSYRKKFYLYKPNNLIKQSTSEAEQSKNINHNRNHAFKNLLSPSIEAYVSLGSNLGLFKENKNIRSLIITSAVSGEGKSTVAINLAKAIATLGSRVLIVDADLRNPKNLTSYMSLNPTKGLSDILLSDTLNVKSVIQQSFVEENLFILSSINSGSDLDTSKLLASSKMRELMEELEYSFDVVIYDVASIIDYVDVSLLANNTDGVVLVTGLGKLKASKLEEAASQVMMSKIPILGVVINKLTSSSP